MIISFLYYLHLLFFTKNKKITIDEFDQYIEPLLRRFLDYNNICVYLKNINKANLIYSNLKYFYVEEMLLTKEAPFYMTFSNGKKLYAPSNESEQAFLDATKASNFISLPFKEKDIIIGYTLFLYKNNIKINFCYKLYINIVSKIIEAIINRGTNNKLLPIHTNILSNSLRRHMRLHNRIVNMQKILTTDILPIVNNFAITSFYMPIEELGGDFFNIQKENEVLIIIVADSVGSGIEACMDATLLKSISDRYLNILKNKSTDEFLRRVNYDLITYSRSKFPSMFAMAIDMEKGICYYSNAGMHLPYVNRNKEIVMFNSIKGRLLGYDKDAIYERGIFKLYKNDIIFLYSDVIDSLLLNSNAKSFEETREYYNNMIASMGDGVGRDMQKIEKELNDLCLKNMSFMNDDASFILLQYLDEKEFPFTFSTLYDIDDIEEHIHKNMILYNYLEWDINSISLSLYELSSNAILYSGNQISKKKMKYKINTQSISFEIEDFGYRFDYKLIMQKFIDKDKLNITDNLDNGGRGIFLVLKTVDNIEYYDNGSKVKVIKKRSENKTNFSENKTMYHPK